MKTNPSGTGPGAGEIAGRGRPVFRRRRYLIHPGYQLRVSVLTMGAVLLLLILLNLSLYLVGSQGAEAVLQVAPELEGLIRAQDRAQAALVFAGSLVFLLGVFVVSVLESHRTAGAAWKLARCLDQVRCGRYRTTATLRRGDDLQEIQNRFNEMTRALQQRTWDEIEELEGLAAAAEAGGNEHGREVAVRLRQLADRKRELVR